MAIPVLKIQEREVTGKGNAKKARKEGKIPVVIYGKGQKTVSAYVNEREIQKILYYYGTNSRVTLDFNGEKSLGIIKEIQRDPIKNILNHIDLQKLNENEKVRLVLPIHLINRESVETSTQIVQLQLNEVEIQTYPRYLPDRIDADASLLKDKDILTISDLNIAKDKNIEILQDKDGVVATMVYATREEVPEEEEETEA